jgi:hypothetical protein
MIDYEKLIAEAQKAYLSGDNTAQAKVKGALQAFVAAPNKALKTKIQSVGVSTDVPRNFADTFSVSVESDYFDMGWKAAFKEVPIVEGQDFWEIYNVTNTLVFNKVPEGDRIKVDSIAATKATVYVDYYGGAIGWTDRMIRYRKVAAMVDLMSVFRNTFWADKANNMYTLLVAAGAGNVTPYGGAAADGQLFRDVTTINTAMNDVSFRNRNKGYGNTAQMPLIMYANPLDQARIERAFNTTANLTDNKADAILKRTVNRIYTYFVDSGSPLLVIPGNKSQVGEGMAPTSYVADQDVLTLNYVQAVWAIYGAAIGDTDVVQTVTLA